MKRLCRATLARISPCDAVKLCLAWERQGEEIEARGVSGKDRAKGRRMIKRAQTLLESI
jgi:hypothetical protein